MAELQEEISEEELKKNYQEIVDTARTIPRPLCVPQTVCVPVVRCLDNGCRKMGGRCVRIYRPGYGVRCVCVRPTISPGGKPLPIETQMETAMGPQATAGNELEFQQIDEMQGECPSFGSGVAYGAGIVIGATALTATFFGLYKLIGK